jgi:tetratricopeptide (TPR) repeat protein
LRRAVRGDIQALAEKSPEALSTRNAICQFWQDHAASDGETSMSPYISLALNLSRPPVFAPAIPEADLPPDAARVLGIVPLLQKFYQAAGLNALWQKRYPEYQSLVEQYHAPLADNISEIDRYLKLPFSAYVNEKFVIYLEPMLSPDRVNSRNYGSNYFVVVAPGRTGNLRMQEIRHTYLHYVMEPLAQSHGTSMKRLEPLLQDVQSAPMDTAFKGDIALLVNESLIRAIEIRTSFPNVPESTRSAYVQHSVEEGFVLTRYFYDQLKGFEKDPSGLRTSYGDMLAGIVLDRERKRARETAFARKATPEVLSSVRLNPAKHEASVLDTAEQRLAAGDAEGAQKLAQQALQQKGGEDPGRANFILAKAAARLGKMQEAQTDFEQAAKSARDPRTLAWSHIYLARIYDIQLKRDDAVQHYRAALAAGDPAPDTKSAAEQGLAAPYAPRKPQ